MKMRIAVVGSGGREHALLATLAQSAEVDRLFAVPGNAGTAEVATNVPGVGATDAVARFAFDEAVLPGDTNVRRVQERTGAAFSPAAAHALMDLGATVCLARVPRCGACPLAVVCPSRGRRYEPARRQSRFEGSFRQRRGRVLRLVAAEPQELAGLDGSAVAALARDGLVEIDEGLVRLP